MYNMQQWFVQTIINRNDVYRNNLYKRTSQKIVGCACGPGPVFNVIVASSRSIIFVWEWTDVLTR